MNNDNPAPPPASFGTRLRAAMATFLRACLNLLVIAMVLALVGIGVYYLRQYLISTQQSMLQLQMAQTQQVQAEQQLNQRLANLQERLNAIEVNTDIHKQAIDELNAELDANQQIIPSTQDAFLASLESTQTAYKALATKIDADLQNLDKKIKLLTSALDQTNRDLDELDERVTALQDQFESEGAPLVVLQRELQLLKAMQLLTRSRIYIVESNLGLAEDDVQAARDLLASLDVPDDQTNALQAIIARLDVALENLPSSPILAAEDLEIAWQLLRNGLSGEASGPLETSSVSAEGTPAPQSTLETTPQGTPLPDITNTPTPSATP